MKFLFLAPSKIVMKRDGRRSVASRNDSILGAVYSCRDFPRMGRAFHFFNIEMRYYYYSLVFTINRLQSTLHLAKNFNYLVSTFFGGPKTCAQKVWDPFLVILDQ